ARGRGASRPVRQRPARGRRHRARRRLLRRGRRGERGRLEPHRPPSVPPPSLPPLPSRHTPGAPMTTKPEAEVPLWNIANILTMLRCVMVPLLVALAVLFPGTLAGRLLVPPGFVPARVTGVGRGA